MPVASPAFLPGPLPTAEVILAPVAAALALAAAMGMAAFEVDLPDYHFGWRQVASVLAAAALVLVVLPILPTMAGGSWGLPAGDMGSAVGAIDQESAATPMRVLWIGDADVLPVRGWALDDPRVATGRDGSVIAYNTSDRALPTTARHGARWHK